MQMRLLLDFCLGIAENRRRMNVWDHRAQSRRRIARRRCESATAALKKSDFYRLNRKAPTLETRAARYVISLLVTRTCARRLGVRQPLLAQALQIARGQEFVARWQQ